MNEGFQFLDIIFLAMLAAFVALRLRSVLGRRTGNERRPSEEVQRRYSGAAKKDLDGAPLGPTVDAPADADYRLILSPSSAAFDGIEAIRKRDRYFDFEGFVAGARGAYELILNAFWEGDRDTLRPFVSDEIFDRFDHAIRLRERDGQTLQNKLERVRRVEVRDAALKGTVAEISLVFVSDVVLVTVDAEGRVVEGNPVDVIDSRDIWTFERDLSTDDPNWTLIATCSGTA
jgi:predicted lipid-binding transport protein (Tim44 family)